MKERIKKTGCDAETAKVKVTWQRQGSRRRTTRRSPGISSADEQHLRERWSTRFSELLGGDCHLAVEPDTKRTETSDPK